MKPSIPVLVIALFLCTPQPPAGSEEDLSGVLSFEIGPVGGIPGGWGGGPFATIHPDSTVIHGGNWAVRLERDEESEGDFTTITKSIPVEFDGEYVEWKGYVKSDSVEGWFGLWMRQDGESGFVQFDNMQQHGLRGTTDWTQYTVRLPLDRDAKQIYFGVLVSGPGKIWADDLELLVDGKPLSEAPPMEREPTVLDTDTEFDEGSGLEFTTLTPVQVQNLTTLGKVWGFLKYHHPLITRGKLHWDYELLRVLNPLREAPDRKAANAVLAEWIRAIGDPGSCKICPQVPKDIHFPADLDWIHDTRTLGDELSALLQSVYTNRHPGGGQFYVSHHLSVGNPIFHHEKGYPDMDPGDTGLRVLALYRFWNIVQYWFPYRDVIGEDWSEVLTEFLPRFVAADQTDAYKLELFALLARVKDTHCNLWGAMDVLPPTGECQFPVRIEPVMGKMVVTAAIGPESNPSGGLEVGDVLRTLDGESVESLIESWSPYYAASNSPTRMRDLARRISNGPCGPCAMTVDRKGKPLSLEVERVFWETLKLSGRVYHDRPGPGFQKLAEDVAYLKLSMVEQTGGDKYARAAQGTRGLIIDCRNYPSGFLPFQLGRHLVAEETPFVWFTSGDLPNPGVFIWAKPVSLTPRGPHYPGKVVILVDEITQSSAEYHAMAFRAAPGAVVVGSTTAGADGNVSRIPLPGGLSTMISGIGVFYPDKTPTQRVGIVPDIEVRPTIQGIMDGRDEVLEAALRVILGDGVGEEAIREMAKR